MREWKFENGIEVYECKYDNDLHCFEVHTGYDYLGTIYPNSIGDMEECINKLDAGLDPITDGWEDGHGHPCSLDGWYDQLFVAVRETGEKIEEVSDAEEGIKLIMEYEEDDKKDGTYTENFYDLVDQDGMSFRTDGRLWQNE